MRQIISILLLFIWISLEANSQDCELVFINKMTSAFSKNQKWLNKKAMKIYKRYSKDSDVSFIFVPEVSIRKGINEIGKRESIILCKIDYWNKNYTKVFVYNECEYLGVIDIFYNEFIPTSHIKYIKEKQNIFEIIKKLDVNVVYNINGFSDNDYYWYIKEKQLFVITEIPSEGLQVLEAKKYLHNVYDPSNTLFLKSRHFKNEY